MSVREYGSAPGWWRGGQALRRSVVSRENWWLREQLQKAGSATAAQGASHAAEPPANAPAAAPVAQSGTSRDRACCEPAPLEIDNSCASPPAVTAPVAVAFTSPPDDASSKNSWALRLGAGPGGAAKATMSLATSLRESAEAQSGEGSARTRPPSHSLSPMRAGTGTGPTRRAETPADASAIANAPGITTSGPARTRRQRQPAAMAVGLPGAAGGARGADGGVVQKQRIRDKIRQRGQRLVSTAVGRVRNSSVAFTRALRPHADNVEWSVSKHLSGHSDGIWDIAVCPWQGENGSDGESFIASASADRSARLWAVESSREVPPPLTLPRERLACMHACACHVCTHAQTHEYLRGHVRMPTHTALCIGRDTGRAQGLCQLHQFPSVRTAGVHGVW